MQYKITGSRKAFVEPLIGWTPNAVARTDGGFLHPLFDGRVRFVWTFCEAVAAPEQFPLRPSAWLTNGSDSIVCWKIADGASKLDPVLALAAGALGMATIDDRVPVPGNDGWELGDAADDEYGILEIARAFGVGILEAGTSWNDARVLSDFDLLSEELDQDAHWTKGKNSEAKEWRSQKHKRRDILAGWARHNAGEKDGPAYIPGEMHTGPRKKAAVISVDFLVFDLDTGMSGMEVDELLRSAAVLALRATTHSHLKTETDLAHSDVHKYLNGRAITTESVQDYMRAKQKLREDLIQSVKLVGVVQGRGGRVVKIVHDPIEKHRVLINIDKPFRMIDHGDVQEDAFEIFREAYSLAGTALGFDFDHSCTDVCRLFYENRHDADGAYDLVMHGGSAFHFSQFVAKATQNRALPLSSPKNAKAPVPSSAPSSFRTSAATASGPKSKTDAGRGLGKWASDENNIKGFQILKALQDHSPEVLRTEGSYNGWNIQCPFDHQHSNAMDPEDLACLAANPQHTPSSMVLIRCQHNGCLSFTNLDMLGEMAGKYFPRAVLDDPAYNILRQDETMPLADIDTAVATISLSSTSEDINTVLQLLAQSADVIAVDDWMRKISATAKKPLEPLRKALKAMQNKQKVATKAKERNKLRCGDETITAEMKAAIEGLMIAIPPPAQAYGKFKYAYFDGRPWLWRLDEGSQDERWERLCTPFGIDEGVCYPDRKNTRGKRIRLFNENEELVEIDLPAGQVVKSFGVEFRTTLHENGVAWTDDGEEFLTGYAKERTPANPIQVHDTPGWKGHAFLTAFGSTVNGNGRVELSKDNILRGDEVAGTSEAWKDAMAAACESGVLHFQIAPMAGLASPIIDLVGLPSMVVCYTGLTSQGKTTSTKISASAGGTTEIKKGLMGSLNCTPKAAEQLMQRQSGNFIGFDEAKFMDGKDFHTLIFRAASDSGTDRLDRTAHLRSTASWKVFVVTSCELPLAEKLRSSGDNLSTGLGVRALDLGTDDQPKLPQEVLARIEQCEKNFGHGLRPFVQHLIDGGYTSNPGRLRDQITKLATALTGENADPAMLRGAQIVAVLWQAGIIAQEAGLLPATFNVEAVCRAAWSKALEAETAPTSPRGVAIRKLFERLLLGRGTEVPIFKDVAEVAAGGDEVRRKWVACKVEMFSTDGAVYVVPLSVLSELSGNSIGAKTIVKTLAEMKALVHPAGSNSWSYISGIGKLSAVIIKASSLENDNEGGDGDT